MGQAIVFAIHANPSPLQMLLDPRQPPMFGWSLQTIGTSWEFDLISFILGLIGACVLVALAYRYRSHFARLRDTTRNRAEHLRAQLTASIATRYRRSLAEHVQTRHLFGAIAPLESVYVEQQLVAARVLPSDQENSRPLATMQAVKANERLVIIGQPGSGRTMLLHYVALHHARVAEEPIPVYLYLPALARLLSEANEPALSRHPSALQQLVEVTLASLSRLIAPGAARWLQRCVQAGDALMLLDGWDELRPDDQPIVTAWIQELVTAHPANHFLITAGERGFAPLVEAGFIPVQLASWESRQFSDLAQRWYAAWMPQHGHDEPGLDVPPVSYGLTPPTPLEATIELIIRLRGLIPAHTPAARMAQVMDLFLAEPEVDSQGRAACPAELARRALGQLALDVLEQQQPILTREQIQSTVEAAMPSSQFDLAPGAKDNTGELDAQRAKEVREEQERHALQVVNCCRDLTATGAPIRSLDKQHFQFSHPLLAAYWAACRISDQGVPTTIIGRLDNPAWSETIRFYAGMASPAPLIQHLLSSADDALLTRLRQAGALLVAAPPLAEPWRAELIKRLARVWMTPRLPGLLREHILVALVGSGEAGIGLLFNRTVTGSDPVARAGAVLGFGALGREQDIPLIEAALSDAQLQVRLAAVHALSILARRGSQEAWQLLISALVEGELEVQQAAVQALVQLGAEGHAVLRDAANDADLVVRRAAVYGLTDINEPWAREILEELQKVEGEWLVRNAAAEALEIIHRDAAPPPLSRPRLDAEPWLIAWAAERGIGTGVGDAALQTATYALAEGEPSTRLLAAETLGRLAGPNVMDDLRRSLRDPDPAVCKAALAALEQISLRFDVPVGQ